MVVTTVLKVRVRDVNISKDGRAESGVCVVDLVVGTTVCRSDGGGPVTVGYTPVQYDTVVVISGLGKTKLTAMPPYDMTRVVRSRASANEEPLPVGVGRVGAREFVIDADLDV
jgi:hypothetical protein